MTVPVSFGRESASAGLDAASDPSLAGVAVRADRLIPIALAGAVLLIALLTVTPWPVGGFQDDAIYTVLAKALATGEGYRMINLPGAPHATHYPPGYPVFLSLLWRLSPSFPDNIVLFKFANAFWLALAAVGAWMFARQRMGWGSFVSALSAASGTLAIVVLLITGVVLSEPMFMAFLFPALLLSERASENDSVKLAIMAGLACGALALVRTLGAVIVPAALMLMAFRRRWWNAAAFAAAVAICVVPWLLWLNAYQEEIPAVLAGKYGAYGPWVAQGFQDGGFAFARAVVAGNIQNLHQFLNFAFMPVAPVWPREVAVVTVCLLGAVGVGVLVRQAPVSAIFLMAYTVVILLWPFEPARFVLGVWPLLTLCGLAGVVTLWRWRPSRMVSRGVRYGLLIPVMAILVGFAAYNARGYRQQWWASVQRDAGRRAKPVAEWVAARTEPTDVLMTDDDLIVFLYAGRQSMPTSTFLPRERVRPLSDEENIAAVRTMMDTYAPRYYITTSSTGRRAAEALADGPAPLLRRHVMIPNAFIYERITP